MTQPKVWDIKIVADTNDANYVTEVSAITDEELEQLKPLIAAIKAFKPYRSGQHTHSSNFPSGEYAPREDLGEKGVRELYAAVGDKVLDLFFEFTPYGEHGIHTIVSIEIAPAATWTKLL